MLEVVRTTRGMSAEEWLGQWCPDLAVPGKGREDEMAYHVEELGRFLWRYGRMPSHAEFDTWMMGPGN